MLYFSYLGRTSFKTFSYSSIARIHEHIPLAAELAFSALYGLKSFFLDIYCSRIVLIIESGTLFLSKFNNRSKKFYGEANYFFAASQ